MHTGYLQPMHIHIGYIDNSLATVASSVSAALTITFAITD